MSGETVRTNHMSQSRIIIVIGSDDPKAMAARERARLRAQQANEPKHQYICGKKASDVFVRRRISW